jgi:hypothetical protein
MTVDEQIEMFKSKKSFIDYLNRAFESNLAGESVAKVEYEVYTKEWHGEPVFQEYLVVTFKGGTKSVRNINGNSNMTNLVELGKLVNGDYYDEVPEYIALDSYGFEYFTLED